MSAFMVFTSCTGQMHMCCLVMHLLELLNVRIRTFQLAWLPLRLGYQEDNIMLSLEILILTLGC